jgi:putative PIN family toxin of toxin-antitoxin system
MPHRLVIDTNVVVSAIINIGYPHKILRELVAPQRVTLLLSEEVLREYRDAISRPKFQRFREFNENAEFILSNVQRVGKLLIPSKKFDLIADMTDNKFIDLGVAHFIITGNTQDFTESEYERIRIISPRDYWETYWT